VAEIRDRAAAPHAVTDDGTRTAETAEPVTAEPAAAENDEMAARHASGPADTPR
jgi:hypothetical protein